MELKKLNELVFVKSFHKLNQLTINTYRTVKSSGHMTSCRFSNNYAHTDYRVT